jgi:WS/DGAT/MGAT family acyltransferase
VARHVRLDRLSPLDVSNLRVEDHGLPMHVAALAIAESAQLGDGSGHLRLGELQDMVESRLHLAPRLRQVVHRPAMGLGDPLWVDDPDFDIRRHLLTRAVRSPGDETALLETCVELNQPRLDRSRPLWELWLLTGLAEDRVGLLIRLHHVLADGVAALAMIGALLDPPEEVVALPAPPWRPRPTPTRRELLADNIAWRADAFGRGLRNPSRLGAHLREWAAQLGRLWSEGRTEPASFNRPVGEQRRLVLARADLERASVVAHRHGGTVNDVILTAVAGGARRLLQARGEAGHGRVLKVSVATSMRAPLDDRNSGNRVGIMIVPVPVGEPDPLLRLDAVVRATTKRKRQPPYQPSARFSQRWMVRVMTHQRLVNLLSSNLPGPPHLVHFGGARILELFQMGVVQGNLALAVGTISYAGRLNLDVVADPTIVPDLDAFAEGLITTLDELGVAVGSGEVGGSEHLSDRPTSA